MTGTEAPPAGYRERPLQPFASFRYRGYPWLWGANVTYGAVVGAQGFLTTWLIIEQLDREYSYGTVMLASSLPVLLLALPAGRFADRGDRRLLLMGSHLAVALILLLTAAVAAGDLPSLLVTLLLVGLGAAAAAVGQPVRLGLIPALVPRIRILNANVLSDLGLALGALAGGVSTPLVADRWGPEYAFLILAAASLAGAALLIPLRVPPRPPEAEDDVGGVRSGAVTIGGGIREGFRFLWERVELRLLLLLFVVAAFLGPWLALNYAVVGERLDISVRAYALLSLLLGVGILLSTIALAFVLRVRSAGLWYGALIVASLGAAVGVWFSASYALTGFLMAVLGLALGVRGVLVATLVQAHTPIAVMGRVMGIYLAVTAAAGLLAQPATRAGQALLGDDGWVAFSAIVLVGIVVLVLWRSPGLRRMATRPDPAEPAGDEATAGPPPG